MDAEVAIFHCSGACMCYRFFVQVEEHSKAPRYSLKCDSCRYLLCGSRANITVDEHYVEIDREYGEPYLSDDALAIGASRLAESERWLGRYYPPKGAQLVQGGIAP